MLNHVPVALGNNRMCVVNKKGMWCSCWESQNVTEIITTLHNQEQQIQVNKYQHTSFYPPPCVGAHVQSLQQ